MTTVTKNFLMKEIIDLVGNNSNKLFYSNIFYSLSANDTLENYSTNSNGIFFNLSEIDNSILQKTYDLIKNYKENEVLNASYEEERTSKLNEYANSFNLKYNPVDDISDYISSFSEHSTKIGNNQITSYKIKKRKRVEDDESSEDDNEKEYDFNDYVEPKDKYVDYELFGDDSDNEY